MVGYNTVGIITRTKNRSLFLKRALLSVKNQDYKDYLHIIINDNGDEKEVLQTILSVWKEQPSNVIVKTINSEGHMERASNTGLLMALKEHCKYITIHDDDDSWSPRFLSIMTQELVNYKRTFPTVSGILCRANRVYETVDNNIIKIDHLQPHATTLPETGILSLSSLLNDQNNFAPIQFLYESLTLTILNYYNEEYQVLGDWEFNLRFLQEYEIATIPNYLAFYHQRISGANMNSIHETSRRLQLDVYRQKIRNDYLRQGSPLGILFSQLAKDYIC